MRGLLTFVLLVGVGGCQSQLHGTGRLFVWNGTMKSVTLTVEGRSPEEVTLFANSGKLLEGRVAGPYQIRVGDAAPVDVSIEKDRLSLFNVGAAGCFARADISGMYRRDRFPVKLIEVYDRPSAVTIESVVNVLPGEPLPQARPKTAFTFQRLVVIDCKLVEKEKTIERYIQHLR